MNELSERLDRLENHFKVYKTDMQDVKSELKEVRILLGGSALNGNKGFIRLMETIEEKVDKIELDLSHVHKDVENVKFWGRGASGFLFAFLLVLVNYIKDKL